jgi:hypothetical protein
MPVGVQQLRTRGWMDHLAVVELLGQVQVPSMRVSIGTCASVNFTNEQNEPRSAKAVTGT